MAPDLPGVNGFSTLGRFLARIRYSVFVILLFVVVVLHTGARWPWTPDEEFLAVARNWPGGSGWDTSIGWLAPARLGISGELGWSMLWIAVIAGSIVVSVICARWTMGDPYARVFLLAIAASSIPFRLTGWIGFYDGLFLSGVLLSAVLGPRLWWIGAVMLAAANPEMGVVAGLAALLVGFGLRSPLVMRRGTGALGLSVLLIALVTIARLLGDAPGVESRLQLLSANSVTSVTSNIGWWPLTVATMFAGAWLVVVVVIVTPARIRGKCLVALGLVVIPLAFTLVTLDGTRVAVASSSLAFVLGVREWRRSAQESLDAQGPPVGVFPLMAILLILAVFTPAVSVLPYSPSADFYPPWAVISQLREVVAL
jgi:hypothetical protein